MSEIIATRASEPDEQVQRYLEMYKSMDMPELHTLSPPEARELQEEFAQEPGIDIPIVEDRVIEGPSEEITVRLYSPCEDENETPLIVYFHGGGFIVGSLNTHDGICRKLAAETGYSVLSVDYRLAPENPFPAGFQDCYAATEWASTAGDELAVNPTELIVAGDSAGGNLAAAVALRARDYGGPDIAGQVLLYPTTGDATETDAYEQNAEGYYLTTEMMEWFGNKHIDDPIDEGNIYANPRLAADLSELPPATVVTAGFDPLRDDGAAYAQRLRDDGVTVHYHNYEGMIHGFCNMIADPVELAVAHEAYDAVASDLELILD